jgi:hypothetical protein
MTLVFSISNFFTYKNRFQTEKPKGTRSSFYSKLLDEVVPKKSDDIFSKPVFVCEKVENRKN